MNHDAGVGPGPDNTRVGAVLFTDLVGFTAFTDAVGDASALALLDRQTELAAKVLAEHDDARIVKELGDGLMIWFGSARDGLLGAVSLMDVIEGARRDGTFPLAIRMGLHHGEAIQRGDDLVGKTINIASRVADLAGPGEILVSDDVVRACGRHRPDLDLDQVGPVTVKGVGDPVWLQRVGARSSSRP
jgi:class 3 adenylate cyclase